MSGPLMPFQESPIRLLGSRMWGALRRTWLRPELRHALDEMRNGAWDQMPTLDSAHLLRLLKAGADPNTRDAKGNSVLHHAVAQDDQPLVRALLSAGADVCVRGPKESSPYNPQGQAWQEARSETMICILLDAGSPMMLEADRGRMSWSPAEMCADRGWARALGQILDACPDEWPSHELGNLASMGTLKPAILAVAVAHGADLDAPDKHGVPALHWATWRGDQGLVTELLSRGADPQIRTLGGRTVLEFVTDRQKKWRKAPLEEKIKSGAPVGENQAVPVVQAAVLQVVLQDTLPTSASAPRRPRM